MAAFLAGQSLARPSFDRYAVAVSGGADSTALCHILSSLLPDQTITALIVDHGLRPESAREAEQTAARLRTWPNVQPVILPWAHTETVHSRLQEQARQARYALMTAYCVQHHIPALFIGHHQDDQMETFLLRLAAGSGLDGLAGMRCVKEGPVTLCRPLLGVSHADLLDYCLQNRLDWIEDPSNEDAGFARVRLRQSTAVLAEEGLTAQRLATTTQRLARAADALDWMTDRLWDEIVTEENQSLRFDLAALAALPDELTVRLIRRGMMLLTPDRAYPARLDALEELLPKLLNSSTPTRRTLGGILFSVAKARNSLHLAVENAIKE